MIIEGTVNRSIDNRRVEIPFFIDTLTGTYSQWGYDTITLGENVDLLYCESLIYPLILCRNGASAMRAEHAGRQRTVKSALEL